VPVAFYQKLSVLGEDTGVVDIEILDGIVDLEVMEDTEDMDMEDTEDMDMVDMVDMDVMEDLDVTIHGAEQRLDFYRLFIRLSV